LADKIESVTCLHILLFFPCHKEAKITRIRHKGALRKICTYLVRVESEDASSCCQLFKKYIPAFHPDKYITKMGQPANE
jgi:hypothetical protein